MNTLSSSRNSNEEDSNGISWQDLYSSLRSSSKGSAYNETSWLGQRYDVEEDFVQETIVRTFKYTLCPNHQGEAIRSLKNFTVVTLRNYREDVRRRDKRTLRLVELHPSTKEQFALSSYVDPAEIAIEEIFLEHLFFTLAAAIVRFPIKQQRALLIDLANHMDFSDQPTLLQQAFLTVGINLQDYQQPLPTDPVEHSCYSSNLHHAYKRVANLACVEPFKVA